MIVTLGNIDYHFLFLVCRLRKGGSDMDFKVVADWKLAVALGSTAVAVIFALKLDPAAVKEVSTYAVDACKAYAIARSGNC